LSRHLQAESSYLLSEQSRKVMWDRLIIVPLNKLDARTYSTVLLCLWGGIALSVGSHSSYAQSFSEQRQISTSAQGVQSVYTADLDGDGHRDVLSASAADNTIAWYKNNGDGTFSEQPAISTNSDEVHSVYTADLDGDGDEDVLSASFGSNTIAWFENTGDGNFSDKQIITTNAESPTSVYVTDLNGDGDKDVLSASLGDDRIAWYENEGNGSFSEPIDLTTSALEAQSVYAADLDGDDDQDVLSASSADNTIAWYENEGGGNFTDKQVITTDAESATSVYAADLDGDGTNDVLSASFEANAITWYENTGNGTFSEQTDITTEAQGATDVYAADLNGDGDQDILSASFGDDKIAWYANQGGGTFSGQQIITTNAVGALSVHAADLTGNGTLDVLSASRDDNTIAWYENLGDEEGGPEPPTGLQATAGDGQIDLTWSPGGDSPAGYNVYRSPSFFNNPIDETKLNTSLLSDPRYTDTALTSEGTYYYRVTAVDEDGNESGPSNQVSATVSSGPFADWPDLADPSITLRIVQPDLRDIAKVELVREEESIVKPVKSGFAEFPLDEPIGDSITEIRLLNEEDQVFGYLPFQYTQSNYEEPFSIDAVIYIHEESKLSPSLGDWSGEWEYYDDLPLAKPLSMLVPPGGDVDEVDLGEKDPVVLVHGVSGSYPSWGGEIRKVRKLTKHLGEEEYDGWQFYYPENQDITKSGPLLAKAIHRLRNNLGYGPDQSFDIVAHSMGGLVSRHYIQRMGIGSPRRTYSQVLNFDPGEPGSAVDRFLMLGTPNHGSYAGYRCTEGTGLCTFAEYLGFDQGAPAFRQMTPGSRFLSDLNLSATASNLHSLASTLVLAGTRNPRELPVQVLEIPNQDDGVVAVSSAGLLDLDIPFATGDFVHTGSLDLYCGVLGCDPRINEDTKDIITYFLEGREGPSMVDQFNGGPAGNGVTGYWKGEAGGSVAPKPANEKNLSVNRKEGILVVNAEENSSFKNVSLEGCYTIYSGNACMRIGENKFLQRSPKTKKFFTNRKLNKTIGFKDIPNGIEGGKNEVFVQEESYIGWDTIDKVSIEAKFLQTTRIRIKIDGVEGTVVESDAFTPSITSSGNNSSSKVNTEVLSEKYRSSTENQFRVDATTDTLTFWLSQDEPGSFSEHDMRLVTPGGSIVDSTMAKSEPNFGYTQNLEVGSAIYLVEDPEPGRWKVRHDTSVSASVSAPVMSTVDLQANAPDSSFTTSETVPVTVSFSGQNTYEYKEITAQLRVENPGGGTTTLGAVGLDESGPATYEAEFSPSYVGSYQISVDFSAKVGGESVRRRTAETVEVTGDSTNTAPKPPSAPTSLSTQLEGREGVALSWSEGDSGGIEGYRVYRDTIPNPTRQVASVPTGQTSYVDSEVQNGQVYYYRITAVGTGGVGSDPTESTSVFTYPSSLSVNIQRSFGSASSEEGYRLIALPGATSQPVQKAFSGEPGSEWQAWWDNGSSENYFQKFDGSDTFHFRAGRGFWALGKNAWSVNRSIETVPLGSGEQTSIPLHDGWNIISNPFGGDVSWAQVDAAHSDSLRALWRFNGSFAQADTFRSARTGEAFYFLNDTGLDSLQVPYPGAPAPKSKTKDKEETSLLTIRARPQAEDAPTATVKVGFDEEASEGLGRLDQPAPPARFSALSLRLQAPDNAPARKRALKTERRPLGTGSDRGQTFQLRLQSETGGPVQITTSGLKEIGSSEAKLLHLSAGRSYDLEEGKPLTIEETDSTEFGLALGSSSYVQNQAEEVVPDEVTLTAYPNPMRVQATVEYSLPEPSDVRVAVYDVLGRQVAVLEEGRRQAGRHRIPLEVSEISSGVYFARLKTDSQVRTQKITVVR